MTRWRSPNPTAPGTYFFAALEYHVEFTVRISSIDERAPTGIENSLRLSPSMCSSLSGRAPKISHKTHSSKLFALALVALQGQWWCPLKQRIAWWKWLVSRLLRLVLRFDGLKDRIAADNSSRAGGV
jgi:hypothetical protein